MATLRTRTVKSAGGDYTSLSAWEAGEQTNLVTADEIRQAECYAMSDTTALVVDGWTTDSTRYIDIVVPTSERHDGKWNTAKYRYEVTSTVGMDLVEDYVRLDGLQISQTTTNNNFRGVLFRNGGEYWCQNCIIKGVYTSTAAGRFVSNGGASGVLKIWNTIIYDGVAGTNGIEGLQNQSTGTIYASNITLQNCRTGYRRNSGTFVAKNCIAQDCNDGWSGTFDAASTNNCSDIASDAPGSNASTGEVTFVNEGSADFHLDASDTVAKDLGTDLSADANIAFSTDIDGATRSGTWDIGADEITSSGVTGSASLTLDALTSSGAGTVSITGSSSQTLGAITVTGAGAVSITGSSSMTIGDITVSGAAGVLITGSSSNTLGALTSTGSGTVLCSGSASITLGDVTVSGSGTVSITGSGSVTLGDITANGSGLVSITGAGSSTLGAITVTATGFVTESGLGTITGSLEVTLGAISINATGIVYGSILYREITDALKHMEGSMDSLKTEIADGLIELEGVL